MLEDIENDQTSFKEKILKLISDDPSKRRESREDFAFDENQKCILLDVGENTEHKADSRELLEHSPYFPGGEKFVIKRKTLQSQPCTRLGIVFPKVNLSPRIVTD